MTIATDLPLHTADGIRELRSRLAMTQQQFAERIGVSPRTIQQWERDRLVPGPDKIAKMRYLASDRSQRAVGLIATLRETATYFSLDGAEGVARELRRIADNHEANGVDPTQVTE